MKNWKPSDFIVLILTITVSAGLLIAIITPGEVLPEKNAELVAGVISAMVAIISMYIGLKLRNSDSEEKSDEEMEDETGAE